MTVQNRHTNFWLPAKQKSNLLGSKNFWKLTIFKNAYFAHLKCHVKQFKLVQVGNFLLFGTSPVFKERITTIFNALPPLPNTLP